ncbi:MAG: alcohol dehydrogenase catalytic domain-containing protein, partial [Thermoplasmatota archaeon]
MSEGNRLRRCYHAVVLAGVMAFVLMNLNSPSTAAGTVPTRGSDLEVGPGYAYSSIQAAYSAASPGDRIVVHPGTYNENIVLDIGVEVHGTALNRADLLQRRGAYPAPADAPADVPGLEFAGIVDAVGEGVDE